LNGYNLDGAERDLFTSLPSSNPLIEQEGIRAFFPNPEKSEKDFSTGFVENLCIKQKSLPNNDLKSSSLSSCPFLGQIIIANKYS
jgi:hypothetical protein